LVSQFNLENVTIFNKDRSNTTLPGKDEETDAKESEEEGKESTEESMEVDNTAINNTASSD
jgi:hypothetical protein